VVAAVSIRLNHAIFKGMLFMAAGIIDHETGSPDMRVLRWLRSIVPWPITANASAIVARASMAGVPLLTDSFRRKCSLPRPSGLGRRTRDWVIVDRAVPMGIFSVCLFVCAFSIIVFFFFGQKPVGKPAP